MTYSTSQYSLALLYICHAFLSKTHKLDTADKPICETLTVVIGQDFIFVKSSLLFKTVVL